MATIEPRRTASGGTSYHAKVRLKGHPTQYASFTRLTDARRWAQGMESAIREGRHFKTAEAKKRTLGEAIDKYSEEVLPGKAKGGANQTAQLAWWKAKLGQYALAELTPARISEHRNLLLQEPMVPKAKKPPPDALPRMRSPATVVRYLAALSHVCSIAIKEWGWMDENPITKIKKPREPRGRERFLSDAERERLLASCEQASHSLYVIVALALSTGMRRGEIMGMRWSQVDFARKRITIHKTKNGEVRVVPLVGHVFELLKAMNKVRRIDCDLVFPGDVAGRPFDIQKPWYAALTAAEIVNFRFHDLRHSAASYLAMNGASMLDIAAVLGHKTLAMVKRYAHVSDLHTERVVEQMTNKIFASNAECKVANE